MKSVHKWAEPEEERYFEVRGFSSGQTEVLDLRGFLPEGQAMADEMRRLNFVFLDKKRHERDAMAVEFETILGRLEYGLLMFDEEYLDFRHEARDMQLAWLERTKEIVWAMGVQHGFKVGADAGLLMFNRFSATMQARHMDRECADDLGDFALDSATTLCKTVVCKLRMGVPFIDAYVRSALKRGVGLLVIADWPRLFLRALELALGHAETSGERRIKARSLFDDGSESAYETLFERSSGLLDVSAWLTGSPLPEKWQKRLARSYLVNPRQPISTLPNVRSHESGARGYCVLSSDVCGTRVFGPDDSGWLEASLAEAVPKDAWEAYARLTGAWAPNSIKDP